MEIDRATLDLLRLTLVPGLGPVRIARVMEAFGSVGRLRGASASEVSRVKGIGPKLTDQIVRGLRDSDDELEAELERIERAGAHVVRLGGPGYPELLAEIPGAPPVLMVRGRIEPDNQRHYPLAMVGSRRCTAYGIEQAERFAGSLVRSGITIVSGGARGIDSAAHRGALRGGGRTIVALGCGLGQCYPPENKGLYDQIVGEGGAVVSELPMNTGPDAKNFPARNRIISGLSLGVLVIEAASRSGALITARHAVEDHGREVMAVPGRIDSPSSEGTHTLLKAGGALLVTEPGDVLAVLEGAGYHQFAGTHDAATRDPTRPAKDEPDPRLFDEAIGLNDRQKLILEALKDPCTPDQLIAATGLDAAPLRTELTMLELSKRIKRAGGKFELV